MKISIISPTIRLEGLEIVEKGLKRQSIGYDEWLVGSAIKPLISEPKWVKCSFKGGYWDLNRSMNLLIKESVGDLIVSVQDYTFINPEALEKFAFYYERNPKSIISGIGDKYDEVYPVVGGRNWIDPRRTKGGFREVEFNMIEGNFCAFPKQAFIDVGGFDESLDFKGFGLDFYSLLDRIDIMGGYKFYLDETNESFSLNHGRVSNWDKDNISAEMYTEIRKEYLKNPILNYLA